MKRLALSALSTAAIAGGLWFAVPLAPQADAAAANAVVAKTVAQAAEYTVDPVHTSVIFGIEWGGMSPFYGQFTDYSGSVTYDGQNPDSFSCEVVIPVDSIDSHNEQRDRHLKSPDFFNGREYRNITFRGNSLTKNDDDTYTLSGELTLRGQTRPVEAKVTKIATQETQTGPRCGLAAEMTIKRSDFGMDFMVGQGLGDEVTLMIGLQSVQQQQQ